MKIVNLEQGSDEWLKFRRLGIGASDAPSIMGIGFKSAYHLYMDKMTGKETFVNAAMQRGKDLEETARQHFNRETGLNAMPVVAVSLERDWQFASLDGLDKDVLVEIKCPGYKDHKTALDGMIPGKYYPQLQHQFSVTGLAKGYYFSFDGEKGVLLEIKRDDDYIEKLLEKEKEFYQRMLDFDPPQLMKEDIVQLDDPEWDEVAAEYILVKQDLTAHEEKETLLKEKEMFLKERLISIAAERNIESSGIRLTKVLRRGAIDYNKIPELANINMEPYRKQPSKYWKISLS